MPRLTIITINKNNAGGLSRTLESIWEQQSFNDFEHIVIDGESCDESVDIIKKYDKKLSYWVSEPDRGIYNAMNKGIAMAKGDYLLFLNSGDWLEYDILTSVFKTNFVEDIVYADLYFFRNDGDIELSSYPDKISLSFILSHSLGHPSTFIKRDLFKYMVYEEKYKIISDWVFFVKQILFYNCTTKHLNLATTYFNVYGISSDPQNKALILQEQSDFFKDGSLHLIFDFYNEYNILKKKSEIQEKTLNVISKNRVQQLVNSIWVQRKVRQCLKMIFLFEKISKIKLFSKIRFYKLFIWY